MSSQRNCMCGKIYIHLKITNYRPRPRPRKPRPRKHAVSLKLRVCYDRSPPNEKKKKSKKETPLQAAAHRGHAASPPSAAHPALALFTCTVEPSSITYLGL